MIPLEGSLIQLFPVCHTVDHCPVLVPVHRSDAPAVAGKRQEGGRLLRPQGLSGIQVICCHSLIPCIDNGSFRGKYNI